MPFSHPMSGLPSNPLGGLQQQHKYENHQHLQQSQYHQRADDMTPPSTYQCHMSRLNIPSSPGTPSMQSLHQPSHSSLTSLQNHHTYSSSSSSPHNPANMEVPHTPSHPSGSVSPPSTLAPPTTPYHPYDPINLGYSTRLSPCNSNDTYQINGGGYGSGNGSSG